MIMNHYRKKQVWKREYDKVQENIIFLMQRLRKLESLQEKLHNLIHMEKDDS
jgi:hypothetical protein